MRGWDKTSLRMQFDFSQLEFDWRMNEVARVYMKSISCDANATNPTYFDYTVDRNTFDLTGIIKMPTASRRRVLKLFNNFSIKMYRRRLRYPIITCIRCEIERFIITLWKTLKLIELCSENKLGKTACVINRMQIWENESLRAGEEGKMYPFTLSCKLDLS